MVSTELFLSEFSEAQEPKNYDSLTAFHSTKSRAKFAKEVGFSLQESVYAVH